MAKKKWKKEREMMKESNEKWKQWKRSESNVEEMKSINENDS